MTDLTRDPIINVVHKGIRRDIEVALTNNCLRAAVILIYAGIDTMAYLGMPEGQEDVERQDFVRWVERFLHIDDNKSVTGLDLYGARCAMLHSYGVVSKLSRDGKCKNIGYMVANRAVVHNPKVHPDLALLSVHHLADAFFKGIDEYLVYIFADKKRGEIADKRFQGLVHQFDYPKGDGET